MKYKPFMTGECEFKITHAEESISKAGNDQMIVDFLVKDINGSKTNCRDYFPANLAWKISALKEELCQPDDGNFEVKDIEGKTGGCITFLENSEQYGVKIKIKGYSGKKGLPSEVPVDLPEPNDDIPF